MDLEQIQKCVGLQLRSSTRIRWLTHWNLKLKRVSNKEFKSISPCIKLISTKRIDIVLIVNYSLIGRDLDDEDSEDDDESSEEEMPKSKVTRNITL